MVLWTISCPFAAKIIGKYYNIVICSYFNSARRHCVRQRDAQIIKYNIYGAVSAGSKSRKAEAQQLILEVLKKKK